MEKAVKTKGIKRQFDALPKEAKKEVIDFIAFLQIRYQRPAFLKKARRAKLRKEPFVGIWKDREDLDDSVSWVRNKYKEIKMEQAILDDDRLKKLMKTALIEVLEERRALFSELFAEALEDFALVNAIKEGETTKAASKEEVFRILKGKA